ncbi:hypothetical protein EVU91_11710 [Macrococcoides bohemicum]|uniref:hypothetical protein n=1 Tax=Macrococcoides bohemicum TaxID=1903056 RepID=UPI0010596403|nr:hypothetical protein [Macrococcus bohemicus]TDL35709.1 hypothetical protein EVU91_11710 [Macrococcus bohemicus]
MTHLDNNVKKVLSHVDWNVLDPQRQIQVSFNCEADAQFWLDHHETHYKEFWKVEPHEVYTLEVK